jgi:pyruvate formate lyase activating enzyme
MKGYVHSIQSLGTVDGPGVRTVVFTEGCPLRCAYCHNPDTWERREEDLTEAKDLAEKILRLYPYIKNGGVTFSGGEPCLEAEFLTELARILKEKELHIALDTSGAVLNERVKALLSLTDLVLLDIKMTTEADYAKYIGSSFSSVLSFLDVLQAMGKPTWIRHVVVPSINDTEEDILRLKALLRGYTCIEKIELLPFKTLCLEKYKSLGTPFPLAGTPALSGESLEKLKKLL